MRFSRDLSCAADAGRAWLKIYHYSHFALAGALFCAVQFLTTFLSKLLLVPRASHASEPAFQCIQLAELPLSSAFAGLVPVAAVLDVSGTRPPRLAQRIRERPAVADMQTYPCVSLRRATSLWITRLASSCLCTPT